MAHQVAAQVGQALRTGGSDEPGGSSRRNCALMSSMASRCACRRILRQQRAHLVRRCEHALDPMHGVDRDGHEFGAAALDEPLEGGAIPRHGSDERVDRGIGAVVEQRRDVAVRIRAEDQPLARGQRALGGLDRGRHAQPHQPAHAAGHDRRLLGLGREHPHRDARPLVDESRVAAHGVLAAACARRCAAARPASRASRCVRCRPRTAAATAARTGAASFSCSCCEILATRHLRAALVLDANVTRRWDGSLSRSNASSGTSTPRCRCSSRCTPTSNGSWPGASSASTARAVSGAGNEVAAQVLGQRADQPDHELLAQRRHLPTELLAAEPAPARRRVRARSRRRRSRPVRTGS